MKITQYRQLAICIHCPNFVSLVNMPIDNAPQHKMDMYVCNAQPAYIHNTMQLRVGKGWSASSGKIDDSNCTFLAEQLELKRKGHRA